jgi:hypothetical protein
VIELALLGLTITGFLVLLDRRDKRAHEDRQAHRLEVAGLCQRIQAPQVAAMDHSQGQQLEPPGVSHPLLDETAAKEEQARFAQELAEFERRLL